MRYPVEFGRHLLLERINVGGMAEVFKAKAFGVEGFERIVAVKRILPALAQDEDFVTMFVDEARIAAHLTHQNIVQIYELGKAAGTFFISMEYVAGKDLRQILDMQRKNHRLLEVAKASYIMACVAEALDYAHRKRDPAGHELKIIHRDVTPQNMILSYEGEVKLCDFGIAKAATRASRTQVGVLKGKYAYMSPEQVRGQPTDRRSDLFALGVIFYEMMTGERLFLAESDYATLEAVRIAHIPGPRRFNPEIPPALEEILMRLLAREPKDRYQWASELHDDLGPHLFDAGRVYHGRHLRAWMRAVFAEDIAAENAKLETFMRLGRPRSDSQSEGAGIEASEPGGGEPDLAPSPAVVLAMQGGDRGLAEDISLLEPPAQTTEVPAAPAISAPRMSPVSSRFGPPSLEADGPGHDPHEVESVVGPAPDSGVGAAEAQRASGGGAVVVRTTTDEEEVEPTLFDVVAPDFGAAARPRGDRGSDRAADVVSHGARNAANADPYLRGEILRRIEGVEVRDDTETLDASLDGSLAATALRVLDPAIDGVLDDRRDTTSSDRVVPPADILEQPTSVTAKFYGDEDTNEGPAVDQASGFSVHAVELAGVGPASPVPSDSASLVASAKSVAGDPWLRGGTRPPDDLFAASSEDSGQKAGRRGNASQNGLPRSAAESPFLGSRFRRSSDARVLILVAAAVGTFAFGLLLALVFVRTTEASLQILTEPSGAVSVFLDGRRVGETTPVEIDPLELGLHTVEIRRPGFRVYTQAIQIAERKPHTMVVPLEPLDAAPVDGEGVREEKVIEGDGTATSQSSKETRRDAGGSTPAGAKARSSRAAATSALEERPGRAGPGTARLERAETETSTVGPRPKDRASAQPSEKGLERDSRERSRTTRPAGDPPVAPRANPEGSRDPQPARLAEAREKPAPEARGSVRSRPAERDRPGFLVVATRPPGVAVWIDGKKTQFRTPIRSPVRLAPGDHVITFEMSNGRRYDFEFEIESGQTTRLEKQLR